MNAKSLIHYHFYYAPRGGRMGSLWGTGVQICQYLLNISYSRFPLESIPFGLDVYAGRMISFI
jgi:hypothetical protein